eukprot:TRINITY_DN27124_c0_g2_i1.p1 TRINITY_DN27124_c0_g2~~TRINITY_DN27124_c0_g2_i1.p1  ORF type:complete len:255 (+),score=19.82 TRINITY_DN27124_c0_g2_i1:151-915(+)
MCIRDRGSCQIRVRRMADSESLRQVMELLLEVREEEYLRELRPVDRVLALASALSADDRSQVEQHLQERRRIDCHFSFSFLWTGGRAKMMALPSRVRISTLQVRFDEHTLVVFDVLGSDRFRGCKLFILHDSQYNPSHEAPSYGLQLTVPPAGDQPTAQGVSTSDRPAGAPPPENAIATAGLWIPDNPIFSMELGDRCWGYPRFKHTDVLESEAYPLLAEFVQAIGLEMADVFMMMFCLAGDPSQHLHETFYEV